MADVLRALANYGSQKKYVFKYVGMNSRMSEPDAAVLDVKLKYLDEDNKKRQELAAYYYENIMFTAPSYSVTARGRGRAAQPRASQKCLLNRAAA